MWEILHSKALEYNYFSVFLMEVAFQNTLFTKGELFKKMTSFTKRAGE